MLESIGRDERNPITGPIYVEGAQPGDVLAVKLLDIRPRGVGVACCGPHAGQLSHWMSRTCTMFFDLSEDGRIVTMRDDDSAPSNRRIAPISFPASPMLGVIGVAPAGNKAISTIPAGKHGGNLDNKCNGIGSTIYIPVNHAGGLLSIGDMHASQGDGEISGNGVEIGGDVLLSCSVIKRDDLLPHGTVLSHAGESNVPLTVEYPVTETSTEWITYGVLVENIPQTTVVACEEAAKLLVGQWGFSPEEAFVFLSVKANLGVCQSCYPDQGTQIAKMSVPKLDVCPRPFKVLTKTSLV